jgi:hypothetical protein
MKIIMTAGDESRALDLSTMPIKDAAECERLTGWSWAEWRENLGHDRANAVAFAWWIAGRRAGVDVGKFSEIDLDLAQLTWSVELDDAEQELIDNAETTGEGDAARPTSSDQEETPVE